MNYKSIFRLVGKTVLIEAAFLLIPALVALIYHEHYDFISFITTAACAAVLGGLLVFLTRKAEKMFYAREGFCAVSIVWIALSLIGAVPFVISGAIPNYIDALFETVSGFTTTGATILGRVEDLGYGMLFWRSFTHWIGGMGILVFVMMLGSRSSDNALFLFRAEMPGPEVGKILPRARETAVTLYRIYLVMTLLEIVALLLGGNSLYDSIVHSMGTAGTGGFGIRSDSIAGYSHYTQWVITIFMILFGINFNIFYFLLIRNFRSIWKSEELKAYLGIIFIATTVLVINLYPVYQSFSSALRLAAFQVASIITTTGFSTANFDLWPGLSKAVLLLLMIIGGCAGSTAGGIKVSRLVILSKTARAEIRKSMHPRHVDALKMDGKALPETVGKGTALYFSLYAGILVVVFLILSIEPVDMETNLSATLACLNNVGPGLSLVGPLANYSLYSPLSKIVLTLAMLLGRLEIYPLLISLSPAVWMPLFSRRK